MTLLTNGERVPSNRLHSINPLETIIGHQWDKPPSVGDAHALP